VWNAGWRIENTVEPVKNSIRIQILAQKFPHRRQKSSFSESKMRGEKKKRKCWISKPVLKRAIPAKKKKRVNKLIDT
jgi:hypothetical protein